MTKETFKILMRHVVNRLLTGKATIQELTAIDPEIEAFTMVHFLRKFDLYVRKKSELVSPYIFLIRDTDVENIAPGDVTRRLWLRLMTIEDKAEILKLFDLFFEDKNQIKEILPCTN